MLFADAVVLWKLTKLFFTINVIHRFVCLSESRGKQRKECTLNDCLVLTGVLHHCQEVEKGRYNSKKIHFIQNFYSY